MLRLFRFFVFIMVGIATLSPLDAIATHLRSGDVIVERQCGSLTYKVTVIAYLNSASSTMFGAGSEIIFGDGHSEWLVPIVATPRPDLGVSISIASYSTFHTYSQHGTYTIYYVERDRSGGILNLTNSHDVPYVTAVTFTTDDRFGCNTLPVLSVVPLDRGCAGKTFFHNSGAFDADGDSLSFELTQPMQAPNSFATYRSPHDKNFYANFEQGNEDKSGPPSFGIDDLDGLVTWDAPGMQGEYAIAFKVIEWRKNQLTGNYDKLSTTIRDMQIIIEGCSNNRPILSVPDDICVVAGDGVTAFATGTDPDEDDVKIELASELLTIDPPAQYSPFPAVFAPSVPPAQLDFNWQTDCDHVRQQPYPVYFKITDNPPSGPKLVAFETWTVRVVAPGPEWQDVTLNVVDNNGILEWEQYSCNATAIQIWRKVGNSDLQPSNCQTGMPGNSGFHLVDVVNGLDTFYVDKNNGNGLSPGATYCYRLVALVGDTKSLISSEICIGPVKRDAPVITHVTVEETSDNGNVRISWLSPSDIDRTQFPEPYHYHVYRADGFVGDQNISLTNVTTDTTMLDSAAATKVSAFNYRIVVYAKPEFSEEFIPVDTSAEASGVWLTATPGIGNIALHWQDSVPWSNYVSEKPFHLIYRGDGDVSNGAMVLIDSVNVLENGFNFIDEGQNGHSLDSTKQYSYAVVTRGTYGNPNISMQENFSQIVSLYPVNDLKPCAPDPYLVNKDCEGGCETEAYTNIIAWAPVFEENCRHDVVSYKIYTGENSSAEFVETTTTTALTYADEDLPSPVRCYKVSAIDENGVEGPQSEAICKNTCPYYALPNVFTPNSDGVNDVFSARFSEDPQTNEERCPRFVRRVKFKVFNRWGKPIYFSDSEQTGNIFVDWSGDDENGKPLRADIYYFVADVEFDVLDDNKTRQLKSWVHLIR